MRAISVKCLVAFLALVIGTLAPTSSAHAWGSKAEALCATHRGPYADPDVRDVPNAAICTANCYSYTLICSDGARFSVSSRYPARASDSEVFLYENSAAAVMTKLAILGAIAFFAYVSFFGTARSREIALYEHGGVVALVGLSLMFWGTGAIEAYHYSLWRAFDDMVGSTTAWVIVPGFVILNAMSFVRGWNYVFVAHPAAPIVRPAVYGQAADVEGLADVLVEGAQDTGERAPYHYEHQAEKARALAQKLNEDSALAEAKAQRELRRAELAAAERALADARKRQGTSG